MIARELAAKELAKARLILAAHEAALLMLKETGQPSCAAQCRVNGLRTKVGLYAHRLRQAEAQEVTA